MCTPLSRVRHEAGEALGAIGTEQCLQPLREHQQDAVQEVRGSSSSSRAGAWAGRGKPVAATRPLTNQAPPPPDVHPSGG